MLKKILLVKIIEVAIVIEAKNNLLLTKILKNSHKKTW